MRSAPTSTQKLTLDLGDFAVESIEVVPATSLDSAAYGYGMPELAASCGLFEASCHWHAPPEESDEA